MSSIIFSLPELYGAYKKWVSENPIKATDYEVTTKWVSYFIAGRINNSHIVSELVYCLSNLLVFFNDRIITNEQKLEIAGSGDKLKLWLTVLEYCEVFLELSARRLWGKTGTWLTIISVQVFKCLSRMLLIFHHKERIIQQPPIPPLHRRDLQKPLMENGVAELAQAQLESVSFNLKRSGKIIRKVDAAPPIGVRTWKPIERARFDNKQTIEQALAGQQLIAEVMYITKPIAHLGAMVCFGYKSWKPWMLSLMLDLGSLHLYNKGKRSNALTNKQSLEISRRYIGLLLYLMRSPFYEKHSRDHISLLLAVMSHYIPLAALICDPLNKYMPFWQNNYFYMWST